MKSFTTKIWKIPALLLLTLGVVTMFSCKKNNDPTIAEVHAVDSDGNPVPYVDVILSCTSSYDPPLPCEVYIVGKADEKGVFSHETDLPKVLRVYASTMLRDTIITGILPDTTMTIIKDSICGETFISIKPHETTVQTVVLYDCN